MTTCIGFVKYLNTLPLVAGLDVHRELELVAAVPAKLGPLLSPGADGRPAELDIALASIIDAARSTTPLAVIPAGMIGCDGPTLTVRLFSAVPIERLSTVFADTDSHTSVALLSVLLQRLHGLRPRIVDFDARERIATCAAESNAGPEWPEAMLLIGDKVVTDSPPAVRYPHQLDLGEAWKRLTGLPFVYAAWMCRRDEADQPAIRAAAELLRRQRLRNTLRLDWLIDQSASERRWPPDLARQYLGELLRFEIGPRERRAVATFLHECHALGLSPTEQVTWAETDAVALG
ncbi:MAG: menaquinone biosynthetic enzyme MqnA/MqnD family protein [Phycisphaerales bacterium]